MSKERQGYIGQDNGKWFARVTFTDLFTGKRRNIKRIVKTEAKAKQLLKELLKKLEGQGVWSLPAFGASLSPPRLDGS